MKLDFHRMGQKLFFVTFAVEGRRPVLSRLVDEKSRPQLLPMGEVVRAACDADDAAHGYAPLGGAGGFPPSVPPALFERSPYIELSFDSRQLKAIRRYIRLNPARKLWRLAHPDLFRRLTGLRHPFLDPQRSWSAIGDATLFASPFLFHVRQKNSGFSQTPALSALEMRKNPEVAHAFRRNCLAMNDLAAALCAAAQMQQ
ncbi:MAG: hypothetical protein IJQ73_14935 [Kiritimatiellae bacterium]|nr:hypothetical protein [Kiritimatiellia bacterium]